MSLSDALCRSYLDLRWNFDPAEGSAAGEERLDPRLGRFDAESVREHLAAFRALEAGIEELEVDDGSDEVDRTALLGEIRATIFRLQHERPHQRNPAFWLLHLCEALHALNRRREEQPDRLAVPILARLRAVPRFLTDAEVTLSEPTRVLVELARDLTGPAADLVSAVANRVAAASVGHRSELLAAAADAEAALARFWLDLDTGMAEHPDLHGPAVGEDHVERLLHHRHAVRAGVHELWRSLLRLEEETEEALRTLVHQAGESRHWDEALRARVGKGESPDPGATAVRRLEEIGRFLDQAGIVEVGSERILAEPLPPHLVPLTAHGRCLPAPPRLPETPAMLMVGAWPSTLAWLSPLSAELGIPGRHLQAQRSERLSQVRRHLAGQPGTGWGLYAVQLLDEAGFWREPADRMMVRAFLLFRIMIARVDAGLHTRQLTFDDAVAMLAAKLPLEPAQAQAAVREVCLEPVRALAEVAGWRELLRLRDDARRRHGAGFSLRMFHDAVLGFGGLPVPLIRWGMGFEE